MGLFDKLRKRTQTAVDEHGDKIAQGIDKAADAADKRTGGKHSAQLDTGAQKAKDALDGLDGTRGDDLPGERPPSGGSA